MYSLFKSQFGDSYVFDDIFNFICNYFNNIFKDIQNIIFYKNEKIIDFYFKDLSILDHCTKEVYDNSSELLDAFLLIRINKIDYMQKCRYSKISYY